MNKSMSLFLLMLCPFFSLSSGAKRTHRSKKKHEMKMLHLKTRIKTNRTHGWYDYRYRQIGWITMHQGHLDLSYKNMTSEDLESIIQELQPVARHLTHLNLAGNKIDKLPTNIGTLTSLQYLNCEGNHCTQVTSNLCNLTNLTTLILPNGRILSNQEKIQQLAAPNTKPVSGCQQVEELCNWMLSCCKKSK